MQGLLCAVINIYRNPDSPETLQRTNQPCSTSWHMNSAPLGHYGFVLAIVLQDSTIDLARSRRTCIKEMIQQGHVFCEHLYIGEFEWNQPGLSLHVCLCTRTKCLNCHLFYVTLPVPHLNLHTPSLWCQARAHCARRPLPPSGTLHTVTKERTPLALQHVALI